MSGINGAAVFQEISYLRGEVRQLHAAMSVLAGQRREDCQRIEAMEAEHRAARQADRELLSKKDATIRQMGEAFLRANAGKEALWAGIGRMVVDRSVTGLIVDGRALLDVVEAARELGPREG